MKKYVFIFILVVILSFTIFAAPKKVAYVINGSLGDQSFYDSGYEGIQNLKNNYGVETRVIECNFDPSLYYPSLMNAARWADVVFVISYGFEEELKTVAEMFPNKIFINIDTVVEDSRGIISNVDYIEEEGAFMTGVVAGLVTTMTELPGINPDKLIGAVGGDDDIVIRSFVYGYEQGAKYVDPEIQVKTIYVGTWDDPVKGKQAALQLYSQGVDIIFQIASLTGVGVLQAAQEVGKYAIGVDTNQNSLAPGHVITSDLKEVGKSIEVVFKDIVEENYKPGTLYRFGLKEGAVGLAIDEYTYQILPVETVNKILEIQQGVIEGKIQVKEYRE
ncbi:membrane protein [Petrotoga sp. 9PW.55.5.1]|uniref:BMP family ABC transporter substrate-binding protein n=1 Tax=Petrotoga sp. 9PW.55.5.1 TaxID=1308979 RepID=UPI000DC34CD9|nr:BMP family ABC transporter substrate-binding protein [Petrotoga sp. 9PW.55.5.1]RAO99791.1 membrane protein [Petrotoga sp. 9PW.55.5.1]